MTHAIFTQSFSFRRVICILCVGRDGGWNFGGGGFSPRSLCFGKAAGFSDKAVKMFSTQVLSLAWWLGVHRQRAGGLVGELVSVEKSTADK